MFDSADMFRAFQPHRDKAIVLVTGTAGRDWREISDNESRDLSLQGAMGQTNTAALGFALAQPNEKVVLFDQSSFSKYLVQGRDSCKVLQRISSANVDVEVGKMV